MCILTHVKGAGWNGNEDEDYENVHLNACGRNDIPSTAASKNEAHTLNINLRFRFPLTRIINHTPHSFYKLKRCVVPKMGLL